MSTIKVRFDYEVITRRSVIIDVEDFLECNSIEQVTDLACDQAPEVEWSVSPDENDIRDLWREVQEAKRNC